MIGSEIAFAAAPVTKPSRKDVPADEKLGSQ
jgi:hypothetical protein